MEDDSNAIQEALAKENRKKAAREKKKAAASEKKEVLTEYETYNVKKKMEASQHDEEVKRQQEQLKNKKAQEKKMEHEKLEKEQTGHAKLSKPEPAMNPFQCFKKAHPKWAEEKVKEEWATMADDKKAV